jgi:nucleotide-binding universal stress UspA family protein
MVPPSRTESIYARILVGLDGSDYSRTAVDYACQLASDNDRVTGIAIVDLPGIERFVGPTPAGAGRSAAALEETLLTDTQAKAQQVLADFAATCAARGVAHAVHAETGKPFEEIIEASKYHDVIVIGQRTAFRYGAEEETGDTLHRILERGLTPVVALPEEPRDIRKVLVTYDDSLQSARAIQMFLMLGIWDHCETTIISVTDDAEDGDRLLESCRDYFASYGVQADAVRAEGRPSAAILDHIRENGTDLLVMGAYGRNRLTNFFVGSTTRAIVQDAGIPIFLYH